MLKRLAVLTIAGALIAPASASAEVTIKVGGSKYREVLYPDSFRIKGKTGAYRGPVTLEVDEFPFDGAYADGGTVDTNSKGEYVFPKVAPSRNARIRARAGNERSKHTTVYVHPGVKHTFKEISGNRMRLSFTYLGHPGFAPPQNAFYAYIAIRGESVLRRLHGPVAMQQIGDGRWRYRADLDEPERKRAYRYVVLYCTRGLSAAGYGRFWPIDTGCGKKVIKG
jgi:hypothetical protein